MTDPAFSLVIFLIAATIFMVAFALWMAIKEKTSKKEAILVAFRAVFMLFWGNLIFVGVLALLAFLIFGILRFFFY